MGTCLIRNTAAVTGLLFFPPSSHNYIEKRPVSGRLHSALTPKLQFAVWKTVTFNPYCVSPPTLTQGESPRNQTGAAEERAAQCVWKNSSALHACCCFTALSCFHPGVWQYFIMRIHQNTTLCNAVVSGALICVGVAVFTRKWLKPRFYKTDRYK